MIQPQDHRVEGCDRRYAAIDIGSNGVRLLLSRVIQSDEYCVFTKESLVRMPIRLGSDVFRDGEIGDEKAEQLVSTMIAYSHLMAAYRPHDHRACATSAMREAKNGEALVQRIREESGIELEIISGGLEAEIIMATHAEEQLEKDRPYLYIDVGGGSTECTVYSAGKRRASRSFPLGTVRMLQQAPVEAVWRDLRDWLAEHTAALEAMSAIGSGGNINKLFRLAGRKAHKPVSRKKLMEVYDELIGYTVDERIRILSLRPDRADVIVPACEVFLKTMQWAKCKQIYIPQFGLADGLVRLMHARTQDKLPLD